MNKCDKENYPTRLEIEKALGPLLAEVLFEQSHPEKKKFFRFPLYLDQLISNKIRSHLTSNDERIKAFTHQDILIVGERALAKYKNEFNVKKNAEYEQDLLEAKYLFAAEKRQALKLQEQRIQKEHEKYYESLKCRLRKEIIHEHKITPTVVHSFTTICRKRLETK